MRSSFQRQAAGFSLVEVSLAILVVGLGLLTVFTLFPAGMTLNKESIDETRAVIFAEEVFNGYRARIDFDPTVWADMGPSYADDPWLESVTYSMWVDPKTNMIHPTDNVATARYEGYVGAVDYACRYTLQVGDVIPNRIKYARIRIWNGEFGPTPLANAMEFYTEFYNYRMKP